MSKPVLPIDKRPKDLPILAIDMPVLYEDEGQEEMGESRPHTTTESILRFALAAHFRSRPEHEVLSDMNLYYHPIDRWAYVSPDVMVVKPFAPLPPDLKSYRIGKNGPAPVLTIEVLSKRTAQQGDLTLKPELYAELGVSEYILIDTTGKFLADRLLLRSLDPATGTWRDQSDTGKGVVSRFGFRIVLEEDGLPRVSDAATGWVYPRPDEADEIARTAAAAEAERRVEEQARLAAEARVRELEAELAKLRSRPTS